VKGFSTMWAVASADDRVMVMIQEVATNPSRVRTNSLAAPERQQPPRIVDARRRSYLA